MTWFTEPQIEAILASETVRAARLVEMQFRSETMRLHDGLGLLKTADNKLWSGLGEMGSMSSLAQSGGTEAVQTTFTLAGVDADILRAAKNSADEAAGRAVTVYGQFFDDDLKLIGSPFAIWSGLMDILKFRAEGPGLRTVTLSAEGVFSKRGRPAWGLYTDKDQKARFEGDRAFEYISDLANHVVTWPNF